MGRCVLSTLVQDKSSSDLSFYCRFRDRHVHRKLKTNQVTMHGSMLSDLEPHPFTFLLFLD